MIITRKTLLLSLLTFCLVIAFLELFLSVLSVASPKVNELLSPKSISRTVPDKRLGHRPNPELADHDSKGFRNPSVPGKAKIVALGDSQTYGSGVASHEAWPYILEQLSEETVYSMAYGGYGPVHNLTLWKEASLLNPEIYIEAFYSGNDLFDSFNLVYNQAQLPDLKTSNKESELDIIEKEEAKPIAQYVSRIFGMGKDKTKTPDERTSFITEFLSSHSKLYGLARKAKHEVVTRTRVEKIESDWERAKNRAERDSDYFEVFENEQFRTIFTSKYRLSALDLDDIRIAEGFRISLESIKRMSKLDVKKQFAVVLIPTKELVFKELVQTPSQNYRTLIENEEHAWKITKEFLTNQGINYVDALPALRDQLDRGVQPYKVSHDGHPNAHGHQAIARLIYTEILKTQNTESDRGGLLSPGSDSSIYSVAWRPNMPSPAIPAWSPGPAWFGSEMVSTTARPSTATSPSAPISGPCIAFDRASAVAVEVVPAGNRHKQSVPVPISELSVLKP